MKRIGLLSDTHGWLDEAVLRHFADCDEVWHAGDIGDESVIDTLEAFKPTRIVFGNIDSTQIRKRTHEHLRFNCEGLDVWITHIGGRPGNYATPVRAELKANAPGLFICGHSHICLAGKNQRQGNLHLNPGAAGTHGFHKVRTLMRFQIQKGKITNLEVVELGPRAVRISDEI
jgi:putative phosphoesterase